MSEVPEGLDLPAPIQGVPRQSASLVVTRDGENGVELLLCHRVPEMPAFPDFWAFIGGTVRRLDKECAENLPELSVDEEGFALAALLREMAEEVAWTVDDDGIKVISEQLRSAILADGEMFQSGVMDGEISCSASAMKVISFRTTPPLSPVRFANRFFHLHDANPPDPILPAERSEFDGLRWMRPQDALAAWERCEMRIPPPQITLLRDLISALDSADGDIESAVDSLAESPPSGEHRIEFAPNVECVPLATATLPPATHTNCYILGESGGELLVVDPAAHDSQELAYLERRIAAAESLGGRIIGTVFTHRHQDHIGDLAKISEIYQAPILATTETMSVIPPCPTDRELVDGEVISLSGPSGSTEWEVLVTEGHCPGHICLANEVGIVTGDLAVMIGTILVPSSDGDMNEYLASLERVRGLEPPMIFPAHGPFSPNPRKLLDHYISHRTARHERVLKAVNEGIGEVEKIAEYAYADTPDAHPILKVDQTISHLRAHLRAGSISKNGDLWSPTTR